MDHEILDREILTVRTTLAVKMRLRKLQGRLQASEGRKITVSEALEVALASAEAQWPADLEASRHRQPRREASRPQPPGG